MQILKHFNVTASGKFLLLKLLFVTHAMLKREGSGYKTLSQTACVNNCFIRINGPMDFG
jgi:hypothetical protein